MTLSQKKSRGKDSSLEKVILATAILNLVKALIDLIRDLTSYRIRLFLAGVKPMKQFMNRLSIILNLICIALNAYIIYLILCKKEEPYE